MSNILVNTIKDTGNNTLLSSDGSGSVTLGSGFPDNTPSFFAYLSSNQSLTDNVESKAQFDTEVFDSDNCYDNSTNYRFTPNVAGKYYIFAAGALDASASNFGDGSVTIFKNGSRLYQAINNQSNNNANQISIPISIIDDANGTTDYYEIYVVCDDSSGNPALNSANRRTYFGAYRIIGA
jgi:hypothetical protein